MLGIDWGTTSLRCYRINASGTAVESRHSNHGILSVANAAFADTLAREAGDWIAAGETPIVMSGMIGSRQGWKEAPYVPCPAGLADILPALCKVEWTDAQENLKQAWIAPGLLCTDSSGHHDVMRGEETQILGILDDLGPGEHHICLPGTHSKWATVRDQIVISFETYMTGEVFALLKQHSILGRTMSEAEFDEEAFVIGVKRASEPGGLLHHLFGVRTEVLLGKLADTRSASYLSGILIGHELHSAKVRTGMIHLMGAPALVHLYAIAASENQLRTVVHDANAVIRGLFALARHLQNSD